MSVERIIVCDGCGDVEVHAKTDEEAKEEAAKQGWGQAWSPNDQKVRDFCSSCWEINPANPDNDQTDTKQQD